MPSGINYSRVNAGGVNSGYGTGPDSFSDLLYEQPATQIRRTTNLASHTPVGVRKNAVMDLAGFTDPFDELAATTAKPRSSTPQLAPDSSHSPLALDPLADLWQGDNNQADLLEGVNTQPPNHQPTTGGHCAQSNNQHVADPWDLDIFGVPPPAAPLHRQSADNINPRPRPHHTGPSSSTGDLLNLGNGDLFIGDPHSSSHVGRSRTSPSLAAEGADSRQQNQQGEGAPKEGDARSGVASPGDEGSGTGTEQRELFIYALPLSKEKLVFLPITGWQEEPKPPPAGVAGSLSNGLNKLQDTVTTMWTNMGNKDQSTIQHKIYQHGQAVIENMSAEERLMKYIPKAATKVVVYHPASIMPTEVQDQLQKLTSNFMVKATGKAAAAGLLLPVAVGIEMIAVPGTGWYALYQLYKSSVTVTGVNRLSQYLKHANNVRVCYAGMEKLDLYVERAKLSPDGLLTQDDVDDLCHELEEPGLHHPLTELRTRYLKRVQHKTGDYALLPANDAVDMEGRSGQADPKPKEQQPKGLGAKLAFWK